MDRLASTAAPSSTTKGAITINNPKAAEAITLAAGWVGKVTPDGVLNYGEEEARGVFQSGNAAFMRNWPYAWAAGNSADSRSRARSACRPAQGRTRRQDHRHARRLAARRLEILEEPELAADLVMFLTSKEEQKRRAVGELSADHRGALRGSGRAQGLALLGSLLATFKPDGGPPGRRRHHPRAGRRTRMCGCWWCPAPPASGSRLRPRAWTRSSRTSGPSGASPAAPCAWA